MEISKWTHRLRNLILDLELTSDEREKREVLQNTKEIIDGLESELEKFEETTDLKISHLKQEISRLNGL